MGLRISLGPPTLCSIKSHGFHFTGDKKEDRITGIRLRSCTFAKIPHPHLALGIYFFSSPQRDELFLLGFLNWNGAAIHISVVLPGADEKQHRIVGRYRLFQVVSLDSVSLGLPNKICLPWVRSWPALFLILHWAFSIPFCCSLLLLFSGLLRSPIILQHLSTPGKGWAKLVLLLLDIQEM